MSELRRVEVLKDGQYVVVRMQDLVVGDQFRMFDSAESPVVDTTDNLSKEWIVTSPPFQTDYNNSLVWGVMAEPAKGV